MEKKYQVFEVFEVFLVQCNLVDNQYQQKSEVLHTFTFTDQNSSPLEIEDKVNLILLIKK